MIFIIHIIMHYNTYTNAILIISYNIYIGEEGGGRNSCEGCGGGK
jgi:hypothetical protein